MTGEASRKKISVGKIKDNFYRLCCCSGMTVREMIDQQSAIGFHTCMAIPFTFKESDEIEAIGTEIQAQHLVTPHGLVFFIYGFVILLPFSSISPCWFPNSGSGICRSF